MTAVTPNEVDVHLRETDLLRRGIATRGQWPGEGIEPINASNA